MRNAKRRGNSVPATPFNYRTTDWVAEARRATNGRGVDVILDIVGGDYMSRNLDLLAVEDDCCRLPSSSTPRQSSISR